MIEKEVSNPLVSVIIPNYNSGKLIDTCLKSVLDQTMNDIDIFVIDDGSSDKSDEIIEDYCSKYSNIYLLRTEGRAGPAKARNIGLACAEGRFIAFLDADDYWQSDKLRIQLDSMIAQGAPISCTAVKVVDERDKVCGTRYPLSKISYKDLIRSTVVTSSVMIDRQIVGDFIMPDIMRRQDLALWLKVVRENGLMLGIQEVLGCYRVHEGSFSRNKLVSAQYTWKVLYEIEKLPFLRALYYYSFYALKGAYARVRGLN